MFTRFLTNNNQIGDVSMWVRGKVGPVQRDFGGRTFQNLYMDLHVVVNKVFSYIWEGISLKTKQTV